MSYHLDWNNIFRDALIDGLGYVPEVGGILAKITGVLWPEDKTDPMVKVQQYVDKMMAQLMEQEVLIDLSLEIGDLRDALKDATDTISTSEYYNKLSYAINKCGAIRHRFVDDNQDKPEQTLRYLVSYGTIRLMLLREEYFHYSALYPAQAGQPPTQDKPPQKLTELVQEIALLKQMVATARQFTWTNRKKCVKLTTNKHAITDTTRTVSDSYQPPDQGTTYSREWFWLHEAHQDHINRLYDIDVADSGWLSGMNSYLDASRFWDDFNPGPPEKPNTYTPIPGFYYWKNRIGDNLDGTTKHDEIESDRLLTLDYEKHLKWDYGTYFDDAAAYNSYGSITQFAIHSDPTKGVTGIEMWYGGVSGGLHGFASASVVNYTLNVGPKHSYITQVGGRTGFQVYRLWFRTNVDVLTNQPASGGGTNDPDNFSLDVGSTNSRDPNLPRLAYISGYASQTAPIGQLRVCWQTGSPDVRNMWEGNKARPRTH